MCVCNKVVNCLHCTSYIDARCIFNEQVIDVVHDVSYYESSSVTGQRVTIGSILLSSNTNIAVGATCA